jgi:hypothetical protein
MEFKSKPDNCFECPFMQNDPRINEFCAVSRRSVKDCLNSRPDFCYMNYTFITGNINININISRGE